MDILRPTPLPTGHQVSPYAWGGCIIPTGGGLASLSTLDPSTPHPLLSHSLPPFQAPTDLPPAGLTEKETQFHLPATSKVVSLWKLSPKVAVQV